MKRFIFIFVLCTALLSSCHSYRDIKFKSADIASVTPVGLTAINAEVNVEIENPTVGFTVKDIDGVLKMKGDSCLLVHSDGVKIKGKCTRTYTLPLQGRIAQGFNPFQLLNIMSTKDLGVFTLDIKARGTVAGNIGKEIEYHDIPLKSIIDKL